MSLASLIREQTVPPVKCKTCSLLARMTPQDRADFDEARGQVTGSVLARALVARLHELDIDATVSDSSVRGHIRDGHGA